MKYRIIVVNGKQYERQVWPPLKSWEDWLAENFPPGKYTIQLEKQRPGEYCRPFKYYRNGRET